MTVLRLLPNVPSAMPRPTRREPGHQDDGAVLGGAHPLADEPGRRAERADPEGDVLAGQRALEIARDASVGALAGRVVIEVRVAEHVDRVRTRGGAQRRAQAEARQPVLLADLVQQEEHLLLAARLKRDRPRLANAGRDEGDEADDQPKRPPHPLQIGRSTSSAIPRNSGSSMVNPRVTRRHLPHHREDHRRSEAQPGSSGSNGLAISS